MAPRKPAPKIARTVALCYVRKSWTRDDKDLISPERQRANIERVCQEQGYTAEWYEDTEGHRSGMHEKNRPGWLALKARMDAPDVAAIVANDLSRLHRKGWRVGNLIDFVEEHGINLILADPERKLDLKSPAGIMFAKMSAFFDEWYAADISMRRKADIAHRKSKGQTVGLPPFGTKRHPDTMLLTPSTLGAWLLPDGTWQAGKDGEEPPVAGALWRGYYQCAEKILTLYAQDKHTSRVLRQLHEEGWAFRDRKGRPAPLEYDDVRRVVANWAEYGGYVSAQRARERHPSDYPTEELIAKLDPVRAVFPIDLLAKVARSRRDRATGKHATRGVNDKAQVYALSGMVFCAQCDKLAAANHNPAIRSLLHGRLGKYYRHKAGGVCGCTKQSIPLALLEGQFMRLIQAIEFKPESIQWMTDLAVQMNALNVDDQSDLEKQRREAIALCNRRIQAAIGLYGDGRISREEYLRRIDQNEREIRSWEARTTESEKLAMEFTMCIEVVQRTAQLWEGSSAEDRQGMARHLFDYVVVDLDKAEIVDFRMKAWADQFLQVATQIKIAAVSNGDSYNDNQVTPSGLLSAFVPTPLAVA